MLTVLGYFVPGIKDIYYSIMVEYCRANVKYFCQIKDKENVLYWSVLMSKYLTKRFELKCKKGSRN